MLEEATIQASRVLVYGTANERQEVHCPLGVTTLEGRLGVDRTDG
jgi:hypothetical protein